MKIIKNRYADEFKRELFEPKQIDCPNCKSTLEYNGTDIVSERRPNGLRYIVCEACRYQINLKP
jgi:DNA-directed RNA polymerase subunit RPC12/RpoP